MSNHMLILYILLYKNECSCAVVQAICLLDNFKSELKSEFNFISTCFYTFLA